MRGGLDLGATSGDSGKPRGSMRLGGPMDSILGVLTQEQLGRWRELAGEPIRGTLRAFPLPFGSSRDPVRPPG